MGAKTKPSSPPTPVNVVVADDHVFIREMIRLLLSREPRYRIVAETGAAEEAVAACERHQPELLILDLNLPGMSGVEAMPLLRKAAPRMRILHFTGSMDERQIIAALRTNPEGFIEKTVSPQQFMEGVGRVASGSNYHCPRSARLLEELRQGRHGGHDLPRLSPREQEVLRLIAAGSSSKEVADKLELSIGTVGVHRTNLMRKLRLHNAAELTRYAVQHGLV